MTNHAESLPKGYSEVRVLAILANRNSVGKKKKIRSQNETEFFGFSELKMTHLS